MSKIKVKKEDKTQPSSVRNESLKPDVNIVTDDIPTSKPSGEPRMNEAEYELRHLEQRKRGHGGRYSIPPELKKTIKLPWEKKTE